MAPLGPALLDRALQEFLREVAEAEAHGEAAPRVREAQDRVDDGWVAEADGGEVVFDCVADERRGRGEVGEEVGAGFLGGGDDGEGLW